jgi:hypothetical protein
MGILDKVVKIEKRIEKLAARKKAPATPIEIRRAILDDIEDQVRPAGRSRKVFPYDRLTIEVLAGRGEATARRSPARAELEAVLNPEDGLVDAIRERLQEAGCDRVGRLEVSVKVIGKARPDWKPGAPFQVTYQRSEAANAPAAPPAPAGPRTRASKTVGAELAPPGAVASAARTGAGRASSAPTAPDAAIPRQAQLVVLEGDATKKAYLLSGERTNIGRLAEVADKHRRVVRRNQVVFLDADNETNQTVSRAQAHIRFAPPAEFRLYDDHSSYGTRILRDGRMIDLPSGSPRGVKLQPGDEIYFGRARVLFRMLAPTV